VRIAILVLAARAPVVLEKQISSLAADNFHFFVHLDAKVDAEAFGFVRASNHATQIETRYNVFWGGFNMVLAELALLRAAMSDPSFERFILISDDSFPIKPAARLADMLAEDCQRIGVHDATNTVFEPRYQGFYFFDSDATNPQFRPPENRSFLPQDFEALRSLDALQRRGKKPIAKVFHGPQWWSLNRSAAAYILEVAAEDEHLRDSFRFSSIPDEHYLQTILGLAPQQWRICGTPMWFDFSKDPKPYVFSNISEMDACLRSDRRFVRKVASDPVFLAQLESRLKTA
jgi:hypothetical protein